MLFFPATYAQCMSQIIDDAVVVIKGRLDRREDVPKLVAMEVSTPDMTAGQAALSWCRCWRAGACRRWWSG